MTATKIQPGNDTHLTLLMAPHSLNFVTGADRAALLAYGRDVFAAGREAKCLAQIQEPAAVAGPAWSKTRDSLAMLLLGLASNPNLSLDVACIALDAATESGMPLAYLRGAPAAPALEAPAATEWQVVENTGTHGHAAGFYVCRDGRCGKEWMRDKKRRIACFATHAQALAAIAAEAPHAPSAPTPSVEAPAAPALPADEFRGDTPSLVRNIIALLEMDAEGCLVPHGVGGSARGLLSAAAARLAAAPQAPAAPVALPPRAKFDAMTAEQEEMAVNFCAEIAGPKGQAGRNPDPVRLLEMAEALYHADAAFVDLPSPAVSDQEIAVRMNRSACQKYPNDINLRIAHNVGWRAARAVLAAPAAPAVDAPAVDALAPVQALLDMHAALLDANPYAYFELSYTRQTGWMAWLTDKPFHGPVINPDRQVLARGQGDTPAEACAAAARAKEGGAA